MNFTQLRHFVVTADTGNILKAAEQLNISQPGLSRSLSSLEHQLGMALFERSAKGVELTGFGRRFYPSARLILNEHRRSIEELKALREMRSGKLAIGISHSFAYLCFPAALSELLRASPDIQVSVVTANYKALADALSVGDLDLVFSLYREEDRRENLLYEPLFELKTRIFSRPGHPLAACDTVSDAQLRASRWGLINGASVESAFASHFGDQGGRLPEVSLRCASVALLTSVIGQTDLLTILPEEIVAGLGALALAPVHVPHHFGVASVGLIRRATTEYPVAERLSGLLRRHATALIESHKDVPLAH